MNMIRKCVNFYSYKSIIFDNTQSSLKWTYRRQYKSILPKFTSILIPGIFCGGIGSLASSRFIKGD